MTQIRFSNNGNIESMLTTQVDQKIKQLQELYDELTNELEFTRVKVAVLEEEINKLNQQINRDGNKLQFRYD